MPTIHISDTLSANVDDVLVNASPLSGLTKYVKNDLVNLVFLPQLIGALEQPLLTAAPTPLSLGLNFADSVDLGNAEPEISIAAGAQAAVNVNATPGHNLFPDDSFGSPVPIQPGQGYVSLALTGSLGVGVAAATGDLSFGVNAGSSIRLEYFRSFNVDPTGPTVAQALGEVISNYVIPADLDDLKQLRLNDVCTVTGKGNLNVSGSVNLAAAINPLAIATIPLTGVPIQVEAGASLTVGASFGVSGVYQLRVRNVGANAVELGYYKQSGQELKADLSASAGIAVDAGGVDLLTKLIEMISKTPQADTQALANGGLTPDEIQKINDVIAGSIARSLKASLDLEFSLLRSDEAAFLYRIDLRQLDQSSALAVNHALDGDLSDLNRFESGAAGPLIAPGITLIRSRLSEMRKRGVALKINLLGIINVSSISQLIQQSDVLFDAATGELTISATAESRQIGVVIDRDKIRHAMYHSLLVTTAYRAGRVGDSMGMTSSDVSFVSNQNTSVQTMSHYLDGFVGLGLISPATKAQLINGFTGTGASTCLLRTAYNDAACDALFFDAAGQLFDDAHYERIGRDAMLALVQPGDEQDPRGFRRATLLDDAAWRAMAQAGSQQAIGAVLGLPRNQAPFLEAIVSDFLVIEWWVVSMRGAGQKLLAMRNFLATADPVTLRDSNEFTKRRKDLEKHMASVVAQSKVHFGTPWGLLALFMAAIPKAQATGILVSPKLSRVEETRNTIAAGN